MLPLSAKKMRNLKRLAIEIKVLEERYCASNIEFPDDGSWVKIRNFPLPNFYNMPECTILIIIPSNYDPASVVECHIPRKLRIRTRKGYAKMSNWHESRFQNEGYQWICFEPGSRFTSLLDFINTLRAYFSDPFSY